MLGWTRSAHKERRFHQDQVQTSPANTPSQAPKFNPQQQKLPPYSTGASSSPLQWSLQVIANTWLAPPGSQSIPAQGEQPLPPDLSLSQFYQHLTWIFSPKPTSQSAMKVWTSLEYVLRTTKSTTSSGPC